MTDKIFRWLREVFTHIREVRVRPAIQGEPDTLSGDLSDYKWTEDTTYTENPALTPDGEDKLAGAVFRGRPSNPLSDDR